MLLSYPADIFIVSPSFHNLPATPGLDVGRSVKSICDACTNKLPDR